MKKNAIIVAGGSGTRIGGDIPKQFRTLLERPMLWWSLKAFYDEDPQTNIILVLPEEHTIHWENLFNNLPTEDRIPHHIVAGGKTRSASVRNGLNAIIADEESMVAVHDAARPLVTVKMITDGWEEGNKSGASVPVIPVTDSLRELTDEGSKPVDRSKFVAVQTPQVFRKQILKEAYDKFPDSVFSDDAAIVEAAGNKVATFPGDPKNMKVTNPGDLDTAELYLKNG